MANIPVKVGEEITAPDTAENVIQMAPAKVEQFRKPITEATITVTAGTIQFSVGEAIAVGHKAWPVNSVIRLSFIHQISELRFKAASNTDKFVINI